MKSRLLKILGTLTFSFAFIIGVACINVHASWEIIPSEDGNILKINNEKPGQLIQLDYSWISYEPKHVVIEGKMDTYDFIILDDITSKCKSIDLSRVEAKEIGLRVITNNDHLEKIIFPYNLEIIGEGSFCSCHNLKEVLLPKSLKTIRIYSFQNCENLELKISSKVKLEKRVFYGCPKVQVSHIRKKGIRSFFSQFFKKEFAKINFIR